MSLKTFQHLKQTRSNVFNNSCLLSNKPSSVLNKSTDQVRSIDQGRKMQRRSKRKILKMTLLSKMMIRSNTNVMEHQQLIEVIEGALKEVFLERGPVMLRLFLKETPVKMKKLRKIC